MSSEKKAKTLDKRKLIMIGLIAAAVIMIVALTLVLVTCAGGDKETDGAGETTVNTELSDDYILFWNVDKELYAGKDATGMSSREPNPDTGYFQITFAMEGRQGIRRVAERRVVNKIDNMELMALVLDDDGIVIDAKSIEDVTGGYAVNKFYVEGIDDNTITVNSSNTFKGMQVELTISDKTKIYDVTGETGAVGCESGLFEMDCVVAIQNKVGEITHIYVVGREPQGPTASHYCDHCDQDITWRAWMYDSTLPTNGSGHYYLNSDIELSGQMSISANTEIVLNLNGKTVNCATGGRMYSLHNEGAYLGIMDYSDGAKGKFKLSGNLSSQGGCVWVRFGKFEMWSGTLDASKATDTMNGVTVCIDSKSVCNLYGGTWIGGTAKTIFNKAAGTTSGGLGGSVISFGQFNMYGGTIKNGKAKSVLNTKNNSYASGCGGNVALHGETSVFTMKGGTIKDGVSDGSGGNIFMGGKCKANIAGGTVSGGETKRAGINGGNIYNGACTLNISGGTIKNGVTRNCAGNIYSSSVLNISGGTITGGKKLNATTGKEETSSNLNIFVVNGVTTISGGKVEGYFELLPYAPANKCDVTISGNPVIIGAKPGGVNLKIGAGTLLKVGKMKSGANISVSANGVFSEKTDETNKQYFKVDNSTVTVGTAAGCLCIGEAIEKCICGQPGGKHMEGCNKEMLAWMAWGNSTSLPTSGNYYLTSNVTLSNKSFTNAKVNIALNGYSIKGGSDRPLQLRQGTVMTLTSWGNSSSTVTGTKVGGSGGLVLLHLYKEDGKYTKDLVAPVLNAFGVHFDASKVAGGEFGGAISVASRTLEDKSVAGSAVNLYGCKVTGATVSKSGGTFHASGKNCKINLVNSTVTGGTAATFGGSICVEGSAALTATNCQITGGTATANQGGNIYTDGANVTLTKCTVSGGTATADTGNNLAIFGNCTVTLNGTTIGAMGKTSRDNIFMNTSSGSLVVSSYMDGSNEIQSKLQSGTLVRSAKSVTLKGNITIANLSLDNTTSGKYPNSDIYLKSKTIDMSQLGASSAIGINTNGLNATISNNVPSGLTIANFTCNNTTQKLVLSGGVLSSEAAA